MIRQYGFDVRRVMGKDRLRYPPVVTVPLVSLLIVLIIIVSGCGDSRPASSDDASPPDASTALKPNDRRSERESLLQAVVSNHPSSAVLVGSQACVQCHAEQCQSVAHTAHGESMSDMNIDQEPPDGEFEHAATKRRYRVYRQNSDFRHREFVTLDDGQEFILADYPIRYTIGSGHHTRSYLVETGSYLVESPATWYATPRRWGLSPGYETNNSGFGRPITFECMFCHTGKVEEVDGSRTHLKIRSLKIDCERCHGPGSLHVAERTAHEWEGDGPDPTIVNPSRISRIQNESVCAQCHLNGAAVVNRQGRKLRDYQPGMSLHDIQIHYRLEGAEKALTVVGHVDQLRNSKCYTKSASMTCITCHRPHAKLPAEAALAHYRNACIKCHDEGSCGLSQNLRRATSAEDSCVDCHMPKRPSDIPHIAATIHRIGIHRQNINEELPEVGTLVAVDDLSGLTKSEYDRYLGLAYLDLSSKDGRPSSSEAYRQKSQAILESILSAFPDDPEVLTALAQTYQRRNAQRSLELAHRTLKHAEIPGELRVRSLYLIADAWVHLRETDKAIPVLEQLIQLRRQAGDWFSLGVCRMRAGDLAGALVAAQQAAQIRPDLPNQHALLAEIYRQSNQSEKANQEERIEKFLKNASQNFNSRSAPN